jgi:hypothetical protein
MMCPGELIGDFHYDIYQLNKTSSNQVYLNSFDPNNACRITWQTVTWVHSTK